MFFKKSWWMSLSRHRNALFTHLPLTQNKAKTVGHTHDRKKKGSVRTWNSIVAQIGFISRRFLLACSSFYTNAEEWSLVCSNQGEKKGFACDSCYLLRMVREKNCVRCCFFFLSANKLIFLREEKGRRRRKDPSKPWRKKTILQQRNNGIKEVITRRPNRFLFFFHRFFVVPTVRIFGLKNHAADSGKKGLIGYWEYRRIWRTAG